MAETDIAQALGQGLALHKAGRLAEAEVAYRDLLERAPGHADVLHLLGVVSFQTGRPQEAGDLLRSAIAARPDVANYHNNLGNAERELNRFAEAESAFRRAIDIDPRHAMAWANLAVIACEQENWLAALEAAGQALAIDPANATAGNATGLARQGLRDLAGARAAFEAVLAREPHNAEAHANLRLVLLAAGDAAGTLALCDAWPNPHDRTLLAQRALALGALGRAAEAAALVDIDRMVLPLRIETPDGFADIAEFNAALTAFATSHPSLVRDPHNKATRRGRQTDILPLDANAALGGLGAAIDRAVASWYGTVQPDPHHPFLAVRPTVFRPKLWATVLDAEGHQMPHIHPAGWLSGVYYSQLPPVVRADDADHGGWIEFGQPDPRLNATVEPEHRLFRPEVGTLIMFPSYFWHRTIPFTSDTARVSFAFDLLPVDMPVQA